jgi:ABC-type dipeptide/oligopeptide/nickel transport system permease subunit
MSDVGPSLAVVLPANRVLARMFAAPGAAFGAIVLAVFIVGAIIAPLAAPYDWNETRVCVRLAAPGAQHWFGCDLYGRDIFSRVLYGARFSLSVGIGTVAVSLLFGALFGTVIGYAGGRIDALGSRVIDVMLGFPPIILAILVVAVLGVGLFNAALAVGIAGIPRFARVVRSATLSLAAREFIEGAQAIGAHDTRVVYRHLLPNLAPTLIVLASLDLGNAVLFTATLSFLGLGAQPPTPEWGVMIAEGRDFLSIAWWPSTFPGLAIVALAVAFSLFGDGLADYMRPEVRK